jgi:hypothetical protein
VVAVDDSTLDLFALVSDSVSETLSARHFNEVSVCHGKCQQATLTVTCTHSLTLNTAEWQAASIDYLTY